MSISFIHYCELSKDAQSTCFPVEKVTEFSQKCENKVHNGSIPQPQIEPGTFVGNLDTNVG